MTASKNILVVAPHCDDAELGSGGTIARYVEEGHSVHVVALSDCRDSIPAGLPSDVLRGEARAAGSVLGATVAVYDFAVRTFPEKRQDILDYLHMLGTTIKPDLVICPAPSDFHQDHLTVSLECLRAFKCSIWATVLPWNTLRSNVNGFVRLEERHIEKKVEALSKYASQSHRAYMDPVTVISWARTDGLQCGAKYAEKFEVLREIN